MRCGRWTFALLGLLASYVIGLHAMIASDAAMALLSSGGHFPAWAIGASLGVLVLRLLVILVLPAAAFAKLGLSLLSWLRAAFARRGSRGARPTA